MPGDEAKTVLPTRRDGPSSSRSRRLRWRSRPRKKGAAGHASAPLPGIMHSVLASTAEYRPDGIKAPPLVAEGRARPADDTLRGLLRDRLGASTWMLALLLGHLLVQGLLRPDRPALVMLAQAWAVVVLGIVRAWLANDRDLTTRQLRALELSVFGGVAALLTMDQYRLMLHHALLGDATLVLSAMKGGVLATVVLLATYGLFIPGNGRRAALVIGPLALLPLAAVWSLSVLHPELSDLVGQAVGLERAGDDLVMLLAGAVLAVCGATTAGAQDSETSEAPRLGPYQLGERIGTGGMGEVYLGEHHLLKRPCAIKLIRPCSAADPRALARFEREVRTTAQLSHWNTVEIYDYGRTEDGTFYYVMEYLPGLSLDVLVGRHGPLPPERVIHLLRQACQALSEAHGLGLIHRDIKPANLFAAFRGGLYDVTKVLDFGLAKRKMEAPSAQLSHQGAITGSPLYMSPEQASGQRADHRSDLYSLGAVAYYLLTGRALFQGDNALSVMIAHARDTAPPPSTLRPDIPRDLEQVVLRCLAKAPADRYQDAASLERALSACASADLWTQDRAAAWWRAAGTPAPSPSREPVASPL